MSPTHINAHCEYLEHESQLFWLMVIAFRNYAVEFGPGVMGTYMSSEKKREKKNTLPTLLHWLLARWLSGVSGLISKQTDLILMPCLQLFSPESFSAELLSWTDTHYMVLVFSRPLPSSIFLPFRPTAAAKIDVFFWGVRDCELVYIKQAEITIPLQQKKINSSNWLCLWKKKNRMVSQALKQIDPYGR